MKKRWICLLLIGCVLCSLLMALPVAAEKAAFAFSASGPESAKPGETVTYTLSLSRVPEGGILSADMEFSYDASVLTLVSSEMTKSPSDGWAYLYNDLPESNQVRFMTLDEKVSTVAQVDELVITMQFRVRDNVPKNTRAIFAFNEVSGSDAACNLIAGDTWKGSVILNRGEALQSPVVTAVSDAEKGGIGYSFTDSNPSDAVTGYDITLYRAEDQIPVAHQETGVDIRDGFFAADADSAPAGKSYYVSVIVRARDVGMDSPAGTSEAVEMADVVTDVSVSVQPRLVYQPGDALDLSGMKVILTYRSGARVTLSYGELAANGITTDPAKGTVLTLQENGNTVFVTCGTITAQSRPFKVTDTVCTHQNTRTETVEPTCDADGERTVICADCGAVISGELLTDRPDHDYDEPVLVMEEASTGNRVYSLTCKNCGHVKREVRTSSDPSNGGETTVPTPDIEPAPNGSDSSSDTSEPQGNGSSDGSDEEKGCRSAVGGLSGVTMLLTAGAAAWLCLRKKKKD